MSDQTEITTVENSVTTFEPIDKDDVKRRIFEIRGMVVMMDADIAEYFGTTTSNLNRAMKRNIKRFPDSFCFQLTREEYREILRFQSGILELEQGKYSKYEPYMYTEQGVAMLTSCLHTERAISASIQIMEAFVEMSHIMRSNQQLLPTPDIRELENKTYKLDERVRSIEENMITKSDLSDFMKLFDQGVQNEEILILDGQPFKADVAYQKIYRSAKRSIIIVDDYIGVKTLQHLVHARPGVKLTIISDNKLRLLKFSEYNDFLKEYPSRTVDFIKTQDRTHDRYIVLDNGTAGMKVYHCGASSKDAGKRITTITRLMDIDDYKKIIKTLLANPPLTLK